MKSELAVQIKFGLKYIDASMLSGDWEACFIFFFFLIVIPVNNNN